MSNHLPSIDHLEVGEEWVKGNGGRGILRKAIGAVKAYLWGHISGETKRIPLAFSGLETNLDMKIMCKLSDESKGGAEMCPSFELDATEALKFLAESSIFFRREFFLDRAGESFRIG